MVNIWLVMDDHGMMTNLLAKSATSERWHCFGSAPQSRMQICKTRFQKGVRIALVPLLIARFLHWSATCCELVLAQFCWWHSAMVMPVDKSKKGEHVPHTQKAPTALCCSNPANQTKQAKATATATTITIPCECPHSSSRESRYDYVEVVGSC